MIGNGLTKPESADAAFERWKREKPNQWNASTYIGFKHGYLAGRKDAAFEELTRLAAWVRSGDYKQFDVRDEIARAIENRVRELPR